jgi:hypothetical protein
MDPATILQLLALGEKLISLGVSSAAEIKADLSAEDQAAITAAVAKSGAAIDAARAQLDADAA